MSYVNLSWLLSRKSFTISYTLYCNRCRVNTTTLANFKANAFTLLNTRYTKKISKFLNTLLETLKKPVPIKGYNRQARRPIILSLQINLQVNKR